MFPVFLGVVVVADGRGGLEDGDTVWETTYLIIAPKKIIRTIYYHVGNPSSACSRVSHWLTDFLETYISPP